MDEFQTFFKQCSTRHANAFLTLMSFSVDPMYEPRNLKSSVKAGADPSRVFSSTCSVLKVMTSVFLALSLRPTLLHGLSILCRSFCAWFSRLDTFVISEFKVGLHSRTRSSAFPGYDSEAKLLFPSLLLFVWVHSPGQLWIGKGRGCLPVARLPVSEKILSPLPVTGLWQLCSHILLRCIHKWPWYAVSI